MENQGWPVRQKIMEIGIYNFHLLRNTCQNMSYILTEAQLLSSALTSAQELYMEIGEKAAGTI